MISFHSPVGHIYFPPVNPSSTVVIISPRLRHWSSTETMISRLRGFWENVVDLTSLLTTNILTIQMAPVEVIYWMDVTGAMLSVCLCCCPGGESPAGRWESPHYPCYVIIFALSPVEWMLSGLLWTNLYMKGHNSVAKLNLVINSKAIEQSHFNSCCKINKGVQDVNNKLLYVVRN